jgi:C1A family cysteine protease
MLVDDLFRNYGAISHKSTSYFPYRTFQDLILNHAILIVGWKDDDSIGNGGYWICKNSWDTDWGYDGFFNIEDFE